MANLAKELELSKARRDAAKSLINSDVDFIKNDVSARSVKDRALNWSQERPPQIGEQALQFAQNNTSKIAIGAGAVAAAIAVIAFRKPLANLATGLFEVLAEMEELAETEEQEGGRDAPTADLSLPENSLPE